LPILQKTIGHGAESLFGTLVEIWLKERNGIVGGNVQPISDSFTGADEALAIFLMEINAKAWRIVAQTSKNVRKRKYNKNGWSREGILRYNYVAKVLSERRVRW